MLILDDYPLSAICTSVMDYIEFGKLVVFGQNQYMQIHMLNSIDILKNGQIQHLKDGFYLYHHIEKDRFNFWIAIAKYNDIANIHIFYKKVKAVQWLVQNLINDRFNRMVKENDI